MKNWFKAVMIVGMSLALAAPVFAGVGTDLSGPHYNLNIIGVPKDKTVPSMTYSNRHTIFVPLNTQGEVPRQITIYYVRGTDFQVLDGNATKDGTATIQVPFQFCEDLNTGCTNLLSYDVYAFGLGKPNGMAVVTAGCTFSEPVLNDQGQLVTCTDVLQMGSFSVTRLKGQPKQVPITDIFRASGCLDLNDSGTCDKGDLAFNDIWIFNIPQLVDYFWDYDNTGLKVMQVRFYPTVSGSIGTVK